MTFENFHDFLVLGFFVRLLIFLSARMCRILKGLRVANLSQPVLRCMKSKILKSLVKNQQLDEISLLVQKAKRFL